MPLAILVAAWMTVAPLLVVCTCDLGHSAIAAAQHTKPACGQCEHDEPVEPPAHQDAKVTVDVNVARAVDAPVLHADLPVACLPDLALTQPNFGGVSLPATLLETGPPLALAASLRSTVLQV